MRARGPQPDPRATSANQPDPKATAGKAAEGGIRTTPKKSGTLTAASATAPGRVGASGPQSHDTKAAPAPLNRAKRAVEPPQKPPSSTPTRGNAAKAGSLPDSQDATVFRSTNKQAAKRRVKRPEGRGPADTAHTASYADVWDPGEPARATLQSIRRLRDDTVKGKPGTRRPTASSPNERTLEGGGSEPHAPGDRIPGRISSRAKRVVRWTSRRAIAAAADQAPAQADAEAGDQASSLGARATLADARSCATAIDRAQRAAIKTARSKAPGKAARKARAHGDTPLQAAGEAGTSGNGGDFGDEAGQADLSGCAGAARRAVPAAVRLPSKAKRAAERTTRAYDAASGRHAATRPVATKRPPHPLAAVQARRAQAISRAALGSAARTPSAAGRAAAHALGTASRPAKAVLSALASGVSASLAPAFAVALTMVAALALAAVVVGTFASCTGGIAGLSGQRGSSLARTALAEYAQGESEGTYHYNDSKYWEFVNGEGTYVSGAETPWCACFVSWCVAKTSGLEGVFCGPTAGVAVLLGHFQASPELGSVYDIEEAPQPREGDIVCFGRDSAACTDHIGIVVEVDADDLWAFTTVEGNTGYSLGGTGGRVYKHRYRAGKGYSLGGYWGYAKVIRPNYPQAFGTLEIPATCDYTYYGTGRYEGLGGSWRDLPLGTFASWECEPLTPAISWDTSSQCYRIMRAWQAKGSFYDPKGFATIDGRYMVACTRKFGEPGDEVVFYFDDGTELACIVTDIKDETEAFGPWPANEWGHPGVIGDEYSASSYVVSVGVLEFFGHVQGSTYEKLGLTGHRTTSAENLGPYAGF